MEKYKIIDKKYQKAVSFQTINIHHLSSNCIFIIVNSDIRLREQFFGVFDCQNEKFLHCHVIEQKKKACDHYYVVDKDCLFIVYCSFNFTHLTKYNDHWIDTLEIYRLQNKHNYLPVKRCKIHQNAHLINSNAAAVDHQTLDWDFTKQFVGRVYGGFVMNNQTDIVSNNHNTTLVLFGENHCRFWTMNAIDMDLKPQCSKSRKLSFNIDTKRYGDGIDHNIVPTGYCEYVYCYIPSNTTVLLMGGENRIPIQSRRRCGYRIESNNKIYGFNFVDKKWFVSKHSLSDNVHEYLHSVPTIVRMSLLDEKQPYKAYVITDKHRKIVPCENVQRGQMIVSVKLSHCMQNWEYERLLWIAYYKHVIFELYIITLMGEAPFLVSVPCMSDDSGSTKILYIFNIYNIFVDPE